MIGAFHVRKGDEKLQNCRTLPPSKMEYMGIEFSTRHILVAVHTSCKVAANTSL